MLELERPVVDLGCLGKSDTSRWLGVFTPVSHPRRVHTLSPLEPAIAKEQNPEERPETAFLCQNRGTSKRNEIKSEERRKIMIWVTDS